ncbi:hypothetical protein [Kitasatospora viridis]|uniref:Uncharacterized protein n=1 Tax=Kitasatospora viridis TaxID=281105 RepID=A0A561SEI1_9ACTN|nr:hypothetical protein [Kitasatospora viridis]TWF73264.1 hypothetical protein FHX73_16415 [Kitasatospora viridis]
MPSDDSITELLREAADLAPDTPGELLADAGERRGRRRTARRRAAVAGGAAVLAVAAVTAVQLRPGGDPVAPAGRPSTTAPELRPATAVLEALLPAGRITGQEALDYGTGAGPTARLVFDDGHGGTLLELTTATVGLRLDEDAVGTQCPDPFMVPVASCTRTVRPDGSILVVEKSAPTAATPVSDWSAVYTGTDGRQVRLDEYNSPTAMPPLSRPEPALTTDQLTTVVTSGSWNRLVAAARPVASPPPGQAAGPVAPRPAALLAVADRLLPAGLQHDNGSTPQTTTGQAHLTVTADGRTSVLVITVDPRLEQGAGDPRRAFEGGVRPGQQLTRTADGSSVITTTTAADATATRVTVQAMLADGTGVTIAETNGSNGYDLQPGRPVLTADQLTALATDPSWRQH